MRIESLTLVHPTSIFILPTSQVCVTELVPHHIVLVDRLAQHGNHCRIICTFVSLPILILERHPNQSRFSLLTFYFTYKAMGSYNVFGH